MRRLVAGRAVSRLVAGLAVRRLVVGLAVVELAFLGLAGCTGVSGVSQSAPSLSASPTSSSAVGIAAVSPSARPSTSPTKSAAPGWWRPRPGLTWQWQLTGTIDTSVGVDVYDVDAFTTPASAVATLHSAGRRAICYVNVGAREDFRPDAAAFPAAVVGKELDGWPGERWLDIRRWDRPRCDWLTWLTT